MAAVPEAAPYKTAIPAITTATAPATRETAVGAGMKKVQISDKSPNYET